MGCNCGGSPASLSNPYISRPYIPYEFTPSATTGEVATSLILVGAMAFMAYLFVSKKKPRSRARSRRH